MSARHASNPCEERALRIGDNVLLCEGAHRACAAENLGLPIRLEFIETTSHHPDLPNEYRSHLEAQIKKGYTTGLLSVDVEVEDAATSV